MSEASCFVLHQLAMHARQRPASHALVAPGRPPLTYRRLWAHVLQTIRTLNQSGLGRGDRVALLLPQGAEMAVACLAVAGGATCAPLNPAYTTRELAVAVAALRPQALLVSAETAPIAHTVASAQGLAVITLVPQATDEAGLFTLAPLPAAPTLAPTLAEAEDVALVLPTSGTTSRPKLVPITHRNLAHTVTHIQATLGLSPQDRCLNVMPLFHGHGLIGALLASLAAGASVVCPPGFYAPRFFAWLEEFQPTWYTAVPTIHQAILARAAEHRAIIQRTPLRFLRASSAVLPAQVAEALEQAFGVPVIEAYGMTEAAHQIASNPLPPGIRKRGSVGMAAGSTLGIMDSQGQLLKAGETGEVVLCGPNVMSGYLDDPAANAEAFTNGWLRTGDEGYLDAEGYLFLSGRLKELINRGGEKIAPREVEDVLLAHPAVAQAVAFALPDARLGEDVATAVVLQPHAQVTEAALRAFAATRLAAFKVPQRLLFVEQIPVSATGKLRRLGLAEALGLSAAPQETSVTPPPAAPPRTPTETLLSTLWCHVLGVKQVSIHDNFFHLGGDSVLATQLLTRVLAIFGQELSILHLFETPTIAQLAAHLDTAHASDAAPRFPPLAPATPEGDAYPLSFAQQRLWFLSQYEAKSPGYNRPLLWRLTGTLQPEALTRSLDLLLERHAALRTTFPLRAGMPVQVMSPAQSCRLTVHDLRAVSLEQRQGEAQALLDTEARRLFDLAADCLMRVTLVQLAEDEHMLLVLLHHLVSDGWSTVVLWQDLVTAYNAYVMDTSPMLPALPVHYGDFTLWQQRCLAEEETLAPLLAYWKTQLAGIPAVLPLPTDHPRPSHQTLHGARVTRVFPVDLAAALTALSQHEGVTLFITLLAAWQVLLARYTESTDIVVGSPIANRTRLETEGLIGLCMNMLALRTELTGNPSFRDILQRVRACAFGAYAHQELPFEKVVEALQPERQSSYPPIFQVVFQLRNLPGVATALHGISATAVELDLGVALYDLALEVTDTPQGLRGDLIYNTDLFEEASMHRLLAHYHTILEAVLRDPAQRLAAVPLLTAAEQQQILVTWNATQATYRPDLGLHTLVTAQVARTPDAVAVVCAEAHLTYRELHTRALHVAQYLRGLGVQPDTLVALATERSLEMVVGILGILYAGGAYVPLDPSYPRERLATILADAQCPLLLTQQHVLPLLPTHQAQVVCLDTDWASITQAPGTPAAAEVRPEHLAYVLYTSGSTGQPKGVMVTHQAISHHIQWMHTTFPLTPDDRILQQTPYSFDVSLWEIFGPLAAGARLILARPGGHQDSHYLVKCLAEQQITVLQTVPAMLQALLVEEELTACRALRWVLCGGEVMPPDVPERLYARLDVDLYNMYGPTETTIDATYWLCPRGAQGHTVPLGRPIANTQVYVLDPQLQPAPIGVPGALYIGGVGLARGYLRQPQLSAAKFIPHPFSAVPEARLFATGDRVRYRPDGCLEFLGRLDAQVKLRGFRIELGEIEATLCQHPQVQEAVVLLQEHPTGGPRLIAYIVSLPGREANVPALQQFLRMHLPSYMLPTEFVLLRALPMLPNGKVNRQALPTADRQPQVATCTPVAPRDALEQQLATLWESLLGVEVGRDDNFFALGGHSLLAVRLCAQIEQQFQIVVPLTTVFQAPSIAQLATAIRQDATATSATLLPFRTEGNQWPLFSVHFGGAQIAHEVESDRPWYGLYTPSMDGHCDPHTVETMATSYLERMQRHQPVGPYVLAGYSFGGLVAFEMAQQLHRQDQEVAMLALIAPTAPQHRRRTIQQHVKRPGHYLTWCLGQWYLRRTRRIPPLFYARYADAMMIRAARAYVPQTYPGRIRLFLPAQPGKHPHQVWYPPVAEGLDIAIVPGDHRSMLQEPYRRPFVQRLLACLPRREDAAARHR